MPLQNEEKSEAMLRLTRIEGQVRGVKRMIDEETYCVDVLTQLASIHEALRGVGKMLMSSHLRRCVTDALREGDEERVEKTYRELMDIFYKLAK